MFNRVVTFAGFGICIAVIASLGCSHTVTTADGSKVTVEPGGKFQSTDSNGNTATVTDNGQKVTVQSKNGSSEYEASNGTVKAHDSKGNSVEIGTGVSEADLGLPFYPGSTETKDSLKSNTDKGTTVQSVRLTADDPAKVVAFYTDKLGKPASSMTSDSMTMATWKSGKRSVVVMMGKQDASNKISLTVVNEK